MKQKEKNTGRDYFIITCWQWANLYSVVGIDVRFNKNKRTTNINGDRKRPTLNSSKFYATVTHLTQVKWLGDDRDGEF